MQAPLPHEQYEGERPYGHASASDSMTGGDGPGPGCSVTPAAVVSSRYVSSGPPAVQGIDDSAQA
jgi:hypothetical protein